jgi:hypothetical protein
VDVGASLRSWQKPCPGKSSLYKVHLESLSQAGLAPAMAVNGHWLKTHLGGFF